MASDYQKLHEAVIEQSESNNWEDAKEEWTNVDDIEEDDQLSSQCVCGHENLRYLFTITNAINGRKLFPIGSTCIKQFENDDLNTVVGVYRQLLDLEKAVKDGTFVELNSDFFSRNMLRYLYDNDAFAASVYNDFDAYNDYKFLLDMFNKRTEPSENQQRKINALVLKQIIPFIRKRIIKHGAQHEPIVRTQSAIRLADQAQQLDLTTHNQKVLPEPEVKSTEVEAKTEHDDEKRSKKFNFWPFR